MQEHAQGAYLERAFEQAQVIDGLSSKRSPTEFAEMVPEVLLGVLAHSTVWTSEPEGSSAAASIGCCKRV